jgi:hypothetical protein
MTAALLLMTAALLLMTAALLLMTAALLLMTAPAPGEHLRRPPPRRPVTTSAPHARAVPSAPPNFPPPTRPALRRSCRPRRPSERVACAGVSL